MKVSVVIPAHNEERYIGRTLAAVKAQSYPDIEIIVVDNDSTDRTAEIVRAIPGVRLVQETRRGVQFAREAGRHVATGDIIVNLDADCRPEPDWISRAVAHFADPRVVGLSGPYQHYDASVPFRLASFLTQNVFFFCVSNIANALFHHGVIAMGGNLFARASALRTIGGYDTTIKFHGDDIDTSNRLAAIGSFRYCNDIAVGSSARRYQTLGYFKVQWRYLINYVWVVFFHRPYRNDFGTT